ncbi:MAG: hypothetical protein K8T10_07085 [Candidatus Eremiobacteraeota bacterium]|nr:hypothetical protein [Candidatus Eremiobacteraeota bacterium]
MKKGLFIILFLVLSFLIGFVSSPCMAQDRDDIFIIGIVEPLNKTQLPGHISFPYYGEVMENILTSSSNNYVVKLIHLDDLEAVGYRFSSIKPDVDIQPSQITKLCDNNRLDAVLTGKLELIERNLEPRFLAEAGRILEFKMEGMLYSRQGRVVWSKTIQDHHEFTREKGKFKPPFQTQVVDFYVSIIKRLSNSLIDRIGTHRIDREPPTIQFENIQSGDTINTTCIILKGLVSDNSKVDLITVNGQKFPLRRPMKEVKMFYPVQIAHGRPGSRVLVTIKAEDIYGFSYAKELSLKWTTNSIEGIVSSINPDTVSIKLSTGDFKRTRRGMGFWIYSVDEFRDPLSYYRYRMFEVQKVGPVVVVKRFPKKNVVWVKFLKGHEKLMDLVKKGDIAK